MGDGVDGGCGGGPFASVARGGGGVGTGNSDITYIVFFSRRENPRWRWRWGRALLKSEGVGFVVEGGRWVKMNIPRSIEERGVGWTMDGVVGG